ncbi:hypothetical protein ACFWDI_40390 [Streptomyces sp. NPDC060064]|uniref:hypothetical protein n=1 Tax=Streptomyces sp. NPDC060064 TaxID=3347049 RepID=UPI0036BAC233
MTGLDGRLDRYRNEDDMPEDPIAQGEIAALTRRYENALQIVRGDIAAMDNRLMDVEGKLDRFIEETGESFTELHQKIDRNQAQIVELLSGLVGRAPNAD